ncbi:unnamed protein product [Danaus chrysippus]|uniref:(African queen) hypothetical protein n=1 Tax=Danaus chrysippus TaxID=151541 RepID=A0A8J2QS62_9NEOP|nr:unnamed protein product [Danaus chrysippus]
MSWEQEQARLAALLEEIISDNEDNVAVESDASLDENFIQESDHDSLSEQDILSESEVEEAETKDRQQEYYIGKDKVTKWHRVKGRTAIRTRAHNIITEAPGPKGHLDRRSSQPGLPKALKRMLNAPGSSTEGMSPTKKQRCIGMLYPENVSKILPNQTKKQAHSEFSTLKSVPEHYY